MRVRLKRTVLKERVTSYEASQRNVYHSFIVYITNTAFTRTQND